MPSNFSFTGFAIAGLISAPLFAADNVGAPDVPLSPPSAPVPAITVPAIQSVIITGSKQTDQDVRRLSTASKLVFGREELDRDGDSSIGEILKRLPGVTVGGKTGRGGDIRMRGLGSGYTQILVNGERMPRGFSLDTLSPDQVERIEIIRAPVAEFSTQAIAGTINIVLREDYHQKQSQLKIADSVEQGRHAPNISLLVPKEFGNLSATFSGSVYQNQRADADVTDNQISGLPSQHIVDQDLSTSSGIHLTPHFSWRLDGGDNLVLQPFVMYSKSSINGTSFLNELDALVAPYQSANWHENTDTTMARMFTTYTHKLEPGSKLEFKFGLGESRNNSFTDRIQNGMGTGEHVLLTTTDIKDNNESAGVKYTQLIGGGHSVVSGVNGEWTHRNEVEIATDNGQGQFGDSGDNLNANTRLLALFVQDEWDITSQWAANVGVRWEGINTTSTMANQAVSNTSSVTSPVAHLVWRIPGASKDQVRLSYTNSYRAPTLTDLVALPALSQNNSPVSPDRIGNPYLKPELAHGFDLSFEHYLSHNGIISANIFDRDIQNLMRHETALVNGRWVSTPTNLGDATTRGIELEAKFDLVEFLPSAPAISLRTNYSRFWSAVQDIQGPNNRLDQQPAQTANVGMDYKMAQLPLTIGGNINWTPAYIVQSTTTQANSIGMKRQFDMYALWKFSAVSQLRLSVNNLVNNNYDTSTSSTLGYPEVSDVMAPTYTTWTLRWELKY